SPWEGLEGQMVLGAKSFVERICRGVRGDEKEQPALRRLADRPRWEDAVAVVEAIKGQKWEQFRDRHRDWGRDLALYLGRKLLRIKIEGTGGTGRRAGLPKCQLGGGSACETGRERKGVESGAGNGAEENPESRDLTPTLYKVTK